MSMPMIEPTISTTRYLGDTRSQPVSAGATAGTTGAAEVAASVMGAPDAAASVTPPSPRSGAGSCSMPSSRVSGMCVLFLLGFGVVGGKRAERLGDEAPRHQEPGADGGGEREPD